MTGICGVDEAGRGPVIGPMVVAGVLVADEGALRGLGLRDSKQLTPERREALAPRIREVARVESVSISAADIDATRAEMTMNELEVNLFASVIGRLRPDVAYVDAPDVDEARFAEEVGSQLDFDLRIVSRHKADERYPVVSAASIVAKVERDAAIRDIEADVGQPIGSGYPSDPVTMAFLEVWIRERGTLPPETRASWETVKRVRVLVAQSRVDEYGEE